MNNYLLPINEAVFSDGQAQKQDQQALSAYCFNAYLCSSESLRNHPYETFYTISYGLPYQFSELVCSAGY
jgi:hypothetical protein